jgi:FkbM family methyltransferase
MMKIAVNQPPPYGAFRPSRLRGVFLRGAQGMPTSWLGKRLALLLRRLALCCRRDQPLDAQADGFRLRVHVADNVSERKFLFMPQFVDTAERVYLAAHLTPGGVFLDIGANAGIYTLSAARAAARLAGARVIAVEANPVMFERLAFNVAANDFGAIVTLLPIALSDHSGSVVFTISATNLGESGIIAGAGQRLEVPCDTLVNMLTQQQVRALDGIKIDVEGAEDIILVPFFTQAPRVLLPRFVIIENSKGLWRSDLLGLMEAKGYRLHSRERMNSIYVLKDE